MEDIGSLIFYVLLAIIAIAGSVQSSRKKKASAGKAFPPKPATTVRGESRPAAQPQPRPQYKPIEPLNEGSYEEPRAAQFAGEGSSATTMAEAFASEGSLSRNKAAAFASEGSLSRNKAAAFASEGSLSRNRAADFANEGVSALADLSQQDFVHTEISDSEIGDAPEYDYNAAILDDLIDGFDLRKAVIYSALLDRKEYTI
ncbi:MAG: hypothetical protein P1P83_10185 [Bacteroidales bacterium]|nr:hypothetical protein [Bacteroidales bacterium]MDT8374358.1 hypothetical protein [Bacteroidales bacterium]